MYGTWDEEGDFEVDLEVNESIYRNQSKQFITNTWSTHIATNNPNLFQVHSVNKVKSIP